MDDIATLGQEIDALEAVHSRLAEIALRDDEQRRHDLIALRRQLALQIAAVGNAAEPIFGTHTDSDIQRSYRAKFSQMRSAAALHQANWPAVMLGKRLEEYRASAVGVGEANRDFVAWIRSALRTMQG